jgi:4-amino-4-deoxy-L-arabinose transferase-like glycosyltransferase
VAIRIASMSELNTGSAGREAWSGPSRVEWFLLGAVVALAAVLRAWGLASFSFWEDELYTRVEATRLFDSPFSTGIEARPLFFLMEHAALWVLPDTEWGMRLLPFIAGLLGVVGTWWVGRKVFGPIAGLVGAFLLALAPWHLYASQMARYWSLVYLLALLSFYLLIKTYETDRPRDYLLTLLAMCAGLLTHPTFLFPACGVALAGLLIGQDGRVGWRWPTRRAWVWLWVPFGAAVAIWYVALLSAEGADAVTSGGQLSHARLLRLFPAIAYAMTPTVAALGVMGAALALWRGPGEPARRWAVMALVGCSAAALFLFVSARFSAVSAPYFTAAQPLLFVCAGATVHYAVGDGRPRRGWLAAALACAFAAGMAPVTVSHLADGTRYDYRPAFAHVRATAPELAVVVWPAIQLEHYAPELRGVHLVEDDSTLPLDSMLGAEGRFWLVGSFRRYGLAFDVSGRRTAWIQEHCQPEATFEGRRVDYQVFRIVLFQCGADDSVG